MRRRATRVDECDRIGVITCDVKRTPCARSRRSTTELSPEPDGMARPSTDVEAPEQFALGARAHCIDDSAQTRLIVDVVAGLHQR